MSIIAEALKKAKDRNGNKEPFKISIKDVVSPDTTIKKAPNKKSTFRFFVILSVLFGGLFLISYSWYSVAIHTPETLTANEEIPAIEEAPPKHTYVKKEILPTMESLNTAIPITISQVNNSLQLSGIMYTPKKPLAVINSNIWGIGDVVNDFKIVEIKEDSVKVMAESQEFVIKLKK